MHNTNEKENSLRLIFNKNVTLQHLRKRVVDRQSEIGMTEVATVDVVSRSVRLKKRLNTGDARGSFLEYSFKYLFPYTSQSKAEPAVLTFYVDSRHYSKHYRQHSKHKGIALVLPWLTLSCSEIKSKIKNSVSFRKVGEYNMLWSTFQLLETVGFLELKRCSDFTIK